MEGDESKPPSLLDDNQLSELSNRVAENVVEFQQFVDEAIEGIGQDDDFNEMTVAIYTEKKAYMKSHIMRLSQLHNSLADECSDLIEKVSKNRRPVPQNQLVQYSGSSSSPQLTQTVAPKCNKATDSIEEVGRNRRPVTQNQHVQSSDSSSSPQVTQTVAPKFSKATGFDVLLKPGGNGYYLSKVANSSHSGSETSMSSVNKPTVPPVSTNDLKVDQTKDSGSDASTSSVNKPEVPPVIDDALKEKETKDPGCGGSDSGSESSIAPVNKPPLTPVNDDDALKVEENMDPGHGGSESGSDSSIASVNKPPLTPVNDDDALKVEETKDSGSEASVSSVNKPPVTLVIDDALKMKETKDPGSVGSDSGSEASISSVSKRPVPPVNDDAIKVEKTNDSGLEASVSSVNKPEVSPVSDNALKVEGTTDSGSESSMPTVNKPPVITVNDDAIQVEETIDSGLEASVTSVNKPEASPVAPVNADDLIIEETKDSECSKSSVGDDDLQVEESDEVLLEKISNLEEEVVSLKQKIKSATDENGELKQEIEEDISDIRAYMSGSKRKMKALEVDLEASSMFVNTIDRHMSGLLTEKFGNQLKHDAEIKELDMKLTEYITLISQIDYAHEMKEKIWNDNTEQLKAQLKEKSESLAEEKKIMEALVRDKSDQNNEVQTECMVKFENAGLVPSFGNVQKITDELKLKVEELETEVNKQMEAISDEDKK